MTEIEASQQADKLAYYGKMADHSHETAKFLVALYTTVSSIYLTVMIGYATFRSTEFGQSIEPTYWHLALYIACAGFLANTFFFHKAFMKMMETYEISMNMLGEPQTDDILSTSIARLKALNIWAFLACAGMNVVGVFLLLRL